MHSETLSADPTGLPRTTWHLDGPALSWGAIVAGAVAAAAMSLILLLLGTGLGLASVSPWAQSGISAAAFGISTIAWITFTQIAASGLGGYLAGRLRRKWSGIHGDETFFRDTAHGFLSWAVATLITAICLTSAIGSMLSSGAQVAGNVAGTAAATAAVGVAKSGAGMRSTDTMASDSTSNYFVDSLFRRDLAAPAAAVGSTAATTAPAAGTSAPAPVTWAGTAGSESQMNARPASAEVTRIFARSLADGGALAPEDTKYVASLVAQRTGLSQQDAESRVKNVFGKAQAAAKDAETKARTAADEARKASAYAALWLFVSLLIGAFVASALATFGGKLRDN